MTEEFQSDPNRDAWKAIKGFLYQIQITVLRWLDLDDNSILYCECGEDIYHVSNLLEAPGFSESRLLEQIKARDRITLRSSESLAALTRYRGSVVANPTAPLLFRFTTTALPGKERGFAFPRGGGINAWTAARVGELSSTELTTFLGSLRALALDAPPPREVAANEFRQFQDFLRISSADALMKDLIVPFEWATSMPTLPNLAQQVPQTLLEQGRAHTEIEALLLTDSLVAHVFRLLSAKGEKRLQARDLEQLLEAKSVTQLDRRLLTRLQGLAERADRYLPVLSSQIENISQRMDTLLALPGQVNTLQGQLLTIGRRLEPMTVPAPELPPRLPKAVSSRPELIATLRARLREVTWLALYGASGMGKTIVAALLFEAWPCEPKVWINLGGDQFQEGATWRLDQHLIRLAAGGEADALLAKYFQGQVNVATLIVSAVHELPRGTLIVVDDIPDLLHARELGSRLADILSALEKEGSFLVTTSQRPVTSRILQTAGKSIVQMNLPSFDGGEIREILVRAGAGAAFVEDKFIKLIHAATQGHPALVYSTVSFLADQGWVVEPSSLPAILSGDPSGSVRRETRRLVFDLVRHEEARELLCRLSLLGSRFSSEHVSVVASVQPVLERPGEHLQELVGPWVTELDVDGFVVSPLLSEIGRLTLSEQRQIAVHNALLRHYLRARELDTIQAWKILIHAIGSRQWKKLTWFLIQLVSQLETKEQADIFPLLGQLFTPVWPDDMDLTSKIMLSAVQVRYLELVGESSEAKFRDLESFVRMAGTEELPAAYGGLSFIGPLNPNAKPADRSMRGLQAWRLLGIIPRSKLKHVQDIPFSVHIWMPAINATSRSDLHEILGVLTAMTVDERRSVLKMEQLPGGLALLIDRYLYLESKKVECERDWSAVLYDLKVLQERAELPGGEALRVPAARAVAVVLSAYLNEPHKALEVLRALQGDFTEDDQALMGLTAGCICLDHFGPASASAEFDQLFAKGSRNFLSANFTILGFAVESATRAGDWNLGLRRAQRILSLPIKTDHYDYYYERLEIIGEVAWIHWSQGNRGKSWGAIYGLVRDLLLRWRREDPRFREVFLKTGHVLGWMTSMAWSGSPPPHTPQGESYSEPFPGWFTRSNPGISDLDRPMLATFMLTQLGTYAAAIHLFDRAEACLLQALNHSTIEEVPEFLLSHINLQLAELASRRESYAEALDFGLTGSQYLVLCRTAREGRLDCGDKGQLREVFWASITRDERSTAQRMVFWLSIGAAIGRLLAKAAHPMDFSAEIDRLEEIFNCHSEQLEESSYWLRLLNESRRAFGPGMDRRQVREQIQGLAMEDSELAFLLNLALSQPANAKVEEICGYQVVSYEMLLKMPAICRPLLEDVGKFVVNTWRHIAATRPFSLRAPKIFKAEIESVNGFQPPDVCRLLLAAVNATGIRPSEGLRKSLREGAANK